MRYVSCWLCEEPSRLTLSRDVPLPSWRARHRDAGGRMAKHDTVGHGPLAEAYYPAVEFGGNMRD